MSVFNGRLDLDLSKGEYVRRLKLSSQSESGTMKYGLEVEPNAHRLPFPASIEEAAYALVGLQYRQFGRKDSRNKNEIEDGRKTLTQFVRRNGPEVYTELCLDLQSNRLRDLDFVHVFDWAESKGYLKALPKDLQQQFMAVAACYRTGESQRIVSRVLSHGIRKAAERLTGYEVTALKTANQSLEPIDPKEGRKGQDSLRHRERVKRALDRLLKVSPNLTMDEFMKSEAFKEACEGTKYTRRTVTRWASGKALNRKPGRHKRPQNRPL